MKKLSELIQEYEETKFSTYNLYEKEDGLYAENVIVTMLKNGETIHEIKNGERIIDIFLKMDVAVVGIFDRRYAFIGDSEESAKRAMYEKYKFNLISHTFVIVFTALIMAIFKFAKFDNLYSDIGIYHFIFSIMPVVLCAFLIIVCILLMLITLFYMSFLKFNIMTFKKGVSHEQ